METEAGEEAKMIERRCVRCAMPTARMCARCGKHVCLKGECNEAHDMKCPPEKLG